MRVVSAGVVAVLIALVVMVEAANVHYSDHDFEPEGMEEAAPRPQAWSEASYEQPNEDMTQAHTEQTGPSKFHHISSLDMDIPNQQCPPNLVLKLFGSNRLCQKMSGGPSCGSVIIPTGGQSYTKVRGRVTGYTLRSNDAFRRLGGSFNTINDPYVDGVSITYGSPRKHIWTYAAAGHTSKDYTCPEIGNPVTKQPAFVGKNYMCTVASELIAMDSNRFFNVPLWTTMGDCVGDCPDDLHFCVTLPQATTANLELRICTDQSKADEDVYIKSYDFYIQ